MRGGLSGRMKIATMGIQDIMEGKSLMISVR